MEPDLELRSKDFLGLGNHGVRGPGGLRREEEEERRRERNEGEGLFIPSQWLKATGKLRWVTSYRPKGKAPKREVVSSLARA